MPKLSKKITLYLYQIAKKIQMVGFGTQNEITARNLLHKTILDRFYDQKVGQEYGINLEQKKILIEQFKDVAIKIQTATSWIYYVILATEIFSIPKSRKGDIIECGCWKGGGTVILSIICDKVNRKLFVADSFEGIPADDNSGNHFYTHLSVMGFYRKGMYDGTLPEVEENIRNFGKIKVCRFIKGFYKDSLKNFSKPLVFAFLDIDLRSSFEDSVRYIWPNLLNESYLYTDDSCDMNVVKFWFDDAWWKKNLHIEAPGYVGSGCGLPINPDYSSLGYARKIINPNSSFKTENWFDKGMRWMKKSK